MRPGLAVIQVTRIGALLLLLTGCPRPPPAFGPETPSDPAEVLEAMRRTQASPEHLVGQAAVHLSIPGGIQGGADHFVAAQRPNSLRMDTLGFFGTPLGMILVHQGVLTVWQVQAGRAFRGPATPESLGLVAAIDLTPEDVVAALLGTPRLIEGEARLELDHQARQYVVHIRGRGGLRQELRIDAGDQTLAEVVWWEGDVPRGRLHYGRYRRGGRALFPYELKYEDASGAWLRVEWQEVHLDGSDFDPAIFSVDLPSEVVVEPLDPARARPALPAADDAGGG